MPISFYVRKDMQDIDGDCPIWMQYTYNYKKYRVPATIGQDTIKCKCEDFIKKRGYEDLKKKRAISAKDRPGRIKISAGPRAHIINKELNKMEERAKNIILFLQKTSNPSVENFKIQWELSAGVSRIAGIFDMYIQEKKAQNKSTSTINNLDKLKNRLLKFNEGIKFSDFKQSFWRQYADFNSHLKTNTLILDQSNLIAFLNWSKNKYHNSSLYEDWPRSKRISRKVYLTPQELMKIRGVRGLSEKQDKIRDIFLWQCHTGMRISEYMSLTKDSLSGQVFSYLSKKKGVDADGNIIVIKNKIAMSPTLWQIWEKYRGELPKFPMTQLAIINRTLKGIAEIAGIEKSLSSSVGRHTFASLMEGWGASKEVIKDNLGHASIKTTENYIHTRKINEGSVIFDQYFKEEIG